MPWMMKSGAWWRILTNHRSLLKQGAGHYDDDALLTAGEYVSKYSRGGFGSMFFGDEKVYRWFDEEAD